MQQLTGKKEINGRANEKEVFKGPATRNASKIIPDLVFGYKISKSVFFLHLVVPFYSGCDMSFWPVE